MLETIDSSSLRQLSANGLSFRVFDQGNGEPVLLLHGFPDDLEIWSGVIPCLLEAGYRVIAFDQRGFGDSSMPLGVQEYSTRKIVDDIPALLTELGIAEPVFVMGHDWGAGIAWALTMFYPERVRALVAVSVGHLHCYGRAGLEQKLIKGFYTFWFQLRGLAEWYLLRCGGLARWLGNEPDVEQIIQRMSRPGRLTAGLSWYRAALLPVMFGSWPRISRPTLGIWSDGDTFLSEAQMRTSSTQMDADWAYERIEGCGHWIPREQPEQLARLAAGWFARHA